MSAISDASPTSAREVDRLQKENIQLKSKIISLEQMVDPEVSSIHESSFAAEFHQQLKQRDHLLDRAKASILSLRNETHMNSAMLSEKQQEIERLQCQLEQATLDVQQAHNQIVLLEKQKDLRDNELSVAKMKMQDLQNELSQNQFMIQDLQHRINPEKFPEPQANTTTEQLWREHLRAVGAQKDTRLQEVQKQFNQQIDQIQEERLQNLQALRAEVTELENQNKALLGQTTELKCVNVSLEEQNKHLNIQLKDYHRTQLDMQQLTAKHNDLTLEKKNVQLENEQYQEKVKLMAAQNDELSATLVNKNLLIEKCKEKIQKLSQALKEALQENDAFDRVNKECQAKILECDAIIKANQRVMSDQETELSCNQKVIKEQKVQLDILNTTVFDLQTNFKKLEANHTELQQIYENKEAEWTAYKQNYQNLLNQNDSLSAMTREQQNQFELLNRQSSNDLQELNELQARVKQYQQEVAQNLELYTAAQVENNQLKTQVMELTRQVADLTGSNEINELEAKNSKDNLELVQKQLNDIREVKDRLQVDFDQVTMNYNILKQQNQTQLGQIMDNNNQNTDLRRKNAMLTQQIHQIQQIMQEIAGQSMIETLTQSCHNSMENSLGNDKIVDQLNNFLSKFNELQNSLSDKRIRVESLQQNNQNKEEAISAMQLQLDGHVKQITDLSALLQEKTEQLSKLTSEHEQMKLEFEANKQTLAQAIDQRNQLKEYQNQMKDKIAKQEQTIRKLKEEKSQLQKSVASEIAIVTNQVRKAVQDFSSVCLVESDLQLIRQEALKLIEKIGQ